MAEVRAASFEVPDPRRFEGDIVKFEERDRVKMPAAGGTLFVGSSSFTRWGSLEEEFREFGAINRGFGGSSFPDLLHYFSRVVLPYRPGKIVVYEGTNDIAMGYSAEQVAGNFVMFAGLVRRHFPEAELYALSINWSPERVRVAEVMREANGLLRGHIATDSRFHYVDLWDSLTGAEGLPDGRYFADPVHPNELGYSRWVSVIRAALAGRAES